jgi:hypothetical protein
VLIIKEPVGGESAVLRRQHYLAPFDLDKTINLVADLRAPRTSRFALYPTGTRSDLETGRAGCCGTAASSPG